MTDNEDLILNKLFRELGFKIEPVCPEIYDHIISFAKEEGRFDDARKHERNLGKILQNHHIEGPC